MGIVDHSLRYWWLTIPALGGGVYASFASNKKSKTFTGKEKAYGRTYIITGASSGLGKETARELAMRGGRVIMACKDDNRCAIARDNIIAESCNRNVICKKCDLGSLKSIEEFAQYVNQHERRVDVLINNAAVMLPDKRQVTSDGFEEQLGVNYLGHFLLTARLLDKIKSCAPARIINVTCSSYKTGKINFDDFNSAEEYNGKQAYKQSKLAMVWFHLELSKRLENSGVHVYSVEPDTTRTKLGRDVGVNKSYLLWPFTTLSYKIWQLRADVGAQPLMFLALCQDIGKLQHGKHFRHMKGEAPLDPQVSRGDHTRLWRVSEKWTRLN